jgi:hypothetical protein
MAKIHSMFRTSQKSSGSRELCLPEVTDIGSVLPVVSCVVSVWLHTLTFGVCVCVCVYVCGAGQTCTVHAQCMSDRRHRHTRQGDMQPNTDHKRDKRDN